MNVIVHLIWAMMITALILVVASHSAFLSGLGWTP